MDLGLTRQADREDLGGERCDQERDTRARDSEHRRAHDNDPDKLSSGDAQRPQGGIVVRLEHNLSRHRLSHEEQRHQQREDPEEDERHHLQMDPALCARGGCSDVVGVPRTGEDLPVADGGSLRGERLPVSGAIPKTDCVEVDVGKLLDRYPQSRRQSLEERRRHIHVLLALVCDVLFGGEREDRAHVGRDAHDPRDLHRERRALGTPLGHALCDKGSAGYLWIRIRVEAETAADVQVALVGRELVHRHVEGTTRVREVPGYHERSVQVPQGFGSAKPERIEDSHVRARGIGGHEQVRRFEPGLHLRERQDLTYRSVGGEGVRRRSGRHGGSRRAPVDEPAVVGKAVRDEPRHGGVGPAGACKRAEGDAAADPDEQRCHHEGAPAGSQLGAPAQPNDAHLRLPPVQGLRGPSTLNSCTSRIASQGGQPGFEAGWSHGVETHASTT